MLKLSQIQERAHAIGPEGTIAVGTNGSAYQQPGVEVEVFRLVKGASALRLIRTADQRLVLSHFRPALGTRSSAVNLPAEEPAGRLMFLASWNSTVLQFVVVWRNTDGSPFLKLHGEACSPPCTLRIGADGELALYGPGIVEPQVWLDDRSYLQPTAIEFWRRSIGVCNALLTASSTELDGQAALARANASVSALITGMEVHVRVRLPEIEGEGGIPDMPRFFRKELSAAEQTVLPAQLAADAAACGETVLQHYIRVRRLSAQGYDRAKELFNWLYQHSIAGLGIQETDISQARIAVSHRHYLTHSDPAANVVFKPKSREIFGFPTAEFATACRDALNRIVVAIHESTLDMRPHRLAKPTPKPE